MHSSQGYLKLLQSLIANTLPVIQNNYKVVLTSKVSSVYIFMGPEVGVLLKVCVVKEVKGALWGWVFE